MTTKTASTLSITLSGVANGFSAAKIPHRSKTVLRRDQLSSCALMGIRDDSHWGRVTGSRIQCGSMSFRSVCKRKEVKRDTGDGGGTNADTTLVRVV